MRVATALVVLMSAGLCLRLVAIGRQGLFKDEIFSASYTGLSWIETIVACLRYDVHSPTYYLQLNLWSILATATNSYGVIAVSAGLLYTFPIEHRREFRAALPKWLGVALPVSVFLLPWMINASTRHVSHLAHFSYSELIYTISGWVLRYGSAIAGWLQSLIATIVALLLAVTCTAWSRCAEQYCASYSGRSSLQR